jgi:thiamine pyrophosphate-dependent acetolactate synthase large subunit-like protein
MATGAALLVETLLAAGVEPLFTLSGNQILSVYDAAIGTPLALYHTRHEASAVHMADAFARLTDRPGVALVTAGPGHLNALSALYGALMEESPVVLLSGASPRSQRGLGAFQEIDQAAAARPVTKAAWTAEDPARLGEDMARALEIATSGRPGPVHLSLPGDVLEATVTPTAAARPAAPARVATSDAVVSHTLALLAEAKRPVIVAGAGMARGRRWAAAQRLAEAIAAPALPSESPRGLNDPWLHGANACLAEADVVLLLGKALDFSLRFGRPPGFAAACRFVHVTAEPVAPNPRSTLTIIADPATVAEQLASAARGLVWASTGWAQEVARVRAATPPAWQELRRSTRAPMHPLAVCAALQPLVDRGAVLIVDGGEFGQWVQAGVDAPVRLINGPSGSIGSAIPMAIAARLVRRDRPVIAALGDGTFGFHPLELDTALRYELPIVAVVGNDARWNAEHQLQLQHYGPARAVACTLRPTRYDRVAEALGGHGEHVERPEELPGALQRAVAAGKPAVVNVMIDGVPAPTFSAGAGAH